VNPWLEGTVVGQTQWSDTLFSLFVDAQIAPFTAGQFTQLSLNATVPHALFRTYSFVNAPDEKPLEFYYNVVKDGKITTSLASLKSGDKVWIKQHASGFFVLSEVPSSETLWLIATGTGLGVFLSLLKTPEPWQRFKNIVLVHSVHYPQGLTHQAVIAHFEEHYHERFCYLPIVTREKLGHVVSSRVTTLFENGELERIVEQQLVQEHAQVMLCGNPAMVQEMSHLLQSRGLMPNRPRAKGHITVESYWKLKNTV
jgi:ferredoxin/flavodoxin---NADP+ reductase